MRRRRTDRLDLGLDDGLGEDPLEGLAHLFDLGVVFALGFMVALLSYLGLPALASRSPKPGSGERVEEARKTPERFRESAGRGQGPGHRLGVAYRLPSGEIVYVPDGTSVDAPKVDVRSR